MAKLSNKTHSIDIISYSSANAEKKHLLLLPIPIVINLILRFFPLDSLSIMALISFSIIAVAFSILFGFEFKRFYTIYFKQSIFRDIQKNLGLNTLSANKIMGALAITYSGIILLTAPEKLIGGELLFVSLFVFMVLFTGNSPEVRGTKYYIQFDKYCEELEEKKKMSKASRKAIKGAPSTRSKAEVPADLEELQQLLIKTSSLFDKGSNQWNIINDVLVIINKTGSTSKVEVQINNCLPEIIELMEGTHPNKWDLTAQYLDLMKKANDSAFKEIYKDEEEIHIAYLEKISKKIK